MERSQIRHLGRNEGVPVAPRQLHGPIRQKITAYQGNVSASLVRVGELFRDAVRLDAAGVILVHNHPSGDPTPSPDDLHLTAEALAAGRLLDIDLLDHLVIGHDAYVSLRDRGVSFDRPGGRGPAAA
ncbi:MAG TPA: JAB domain-containing protein [Candidatus Limnocylindrales bacterium]